MHAGRSVDTTMSFTALDGLLMELDSALLIQRRDLSHARTQHARAVEIEDLLYHRSGLLGISENVDSVMALFLSLCEPGITPRRHGSERRGVAG
jgi:acetate kinase